MNTLTKKKIIRTIENINEGYESRNVSVTCHSGVA